METNMNDANGHSKPGAVKEARQAGVIRALRALRHRAMQQAVLALLVALVAGLAVLGCGAEPAGAVDAGTEVGAGGGTGGDEPADVPPVTVDAVNVYDGLQAYELSGDPAEARTVSRLDEGEVLTAFPEEELVQPSGFGIRVQRLIREDGSEVWANHAYQIEGARPGVIIDEDFVYTGPRITQINENLRVPRTQIVAVVEEQSTDDFYRIAWNDYRTGGQYGELRTSDYVEQEIVSFFPADLTVVRILDRASELNDRDAKRVLLRNALEQSGSQLLDIVRQELDKLDAEERSGEAGTS